MLRIIGKQFKRPSGLLGKIISLVMLKGNSSDYDKMIPELDINTHDRILEIGYGHGLGVDRIASGFDCSVTGIDFSELMYRMACKRNRKHIENKSVALFYGDFLTTEALSHQFDKIFCIHVIYFWDHLDQPFSRINTLLRDGGLFCLFMAHPDFIRKMKFTKDGIFNKYSVEQVVAALQSTGFRDIQYIRNDKGYIIKGRK
jgi:cyclopropane fatty-acyl-phospholipid synthase-like methyltransferase